ncbi:DUF2585 domain-containing protein [Cereibacter sphaeroides]|nr:DUF2585 domain-containing protein [Cereibacter sphaeroides]
MRFLAILAALGVPVIGVTLFLWGQPLICTCGEVKLWVNSVFDEGNSQHIADWYTLSHIVHGLLIALIGRALGLRATTLFALAIVTGVAWEIIEHTDWVLEKFRATTINQGYVGDSVLNAVCDYLFMLAGFVVALRVRKRWIVAAILALEIVATVVARDSLTLTTLMLVWPVEVIDDWQQELNPHRDEALSEPAATG